MMEQAPRLIDALIAGLNKVSPALQVTRENFRALASEGELTTGRILAAIESQAPAIAREFAELPLTIGGAMTTIGNSFQLMIGEADSASAASRSLARELALIGDLLASPAFRSGFSEFTGVLLWELRRELGLVGSALSALRSAAELVGLAPSAPPPDILGLGGIGDLARRHDAIGVAQRLAGPAPAGWCERLGRTGF